MAKSPLRVSIAHAPRDFLYVSLTAPIGLTWFILLVTLFAVGIGTSVVIIGIPLLALTLWLCHWGANTERERAALVFGSPIAHPPAPRPREGRLGALRARAASRTTWKELGYMLLLGPVGILAGGFVVALWSVVVAGLAAPAVAAAAPHQSWLGGLTASAFAGLVAGAIVLAAISVIVTRAIALGCGAIAAGLLAPDERALLAARVEKLETTRAGAVESADARLRRLERDLHDGAQHRLAYIAMELDRARTRMHQDPAAASDLLTRAHEESKKAMVELRDLVRGIHPSVLTDRGIDAAISGLAERCPVPVDVTARLEHRLPAAIETAAYYVVAEALTNVGKHSHAGRASVTIRRDGELVLIEVRDDGQGGAARVPGSGLEGLAQRVEALDGRLAIDSPAGGPTIVRAELPCAS